MTTQLKNKSTVTSYFKLSSFHFTGESVSEVHPDKIADQISDAILDAYLSLDENAKVACECLITSGLLVIAGEVRSTPLVDAMTTAKEVIRNIGYTHVDYGFDVEITMGPVE
ncbi:MAG: hypothetical protein M3Q56_08460 [Bacteroidota bacterium]|nr:hypothetical protein [Bacteroidota bacterium]